MYVCMYVCIYVITFLGLIAFPVLSVCCWCFFALGRRVSSPNSLFSLTFPFLFRVVTVYGYRFPFLSCLLKYMFALLTFPPCRFPRKQLGSNALANAQCCPPFLFCSCFGCVFASKFLSWGRRGFVARCCSQELLPILVRSFFLPDVVRGICYQRLFGGFVARYCSEDLLPNVVRKVC